MTVMVTAIIAAGGLGSRVGADRPKQLLSVAGTTILQRSLTALDRCSRVDEIILVMPSGELPAPLPVQALCGTPMRVVSGGPRRQDSVALGFDAASPESDLFVIHDAVRPLCPDNLIVRTLEAAERHGAAIAALPAQETVKQRAVGDSRFVGRTLARQMLVIAQTPQAFRRAVLADAIRLGRGGVEATDEAVLAERAGHRVALVDGEPQNIKITTVHDLTVVERLLGGTVAAARVGFGYDLHRLVEGRPLILAGVEIPHDRGLSGHSDADAVCHAVTDAMLGAAAAGDIGEHFPDTESRWEGAASVGLLRVVVDLVRARGFEVSNLDVVVVAERPKIGPHVIRMRESLAAAVGVDLDQVSIKGKTNEGLGAIGRGEAIAAHAVALLRMS